MKPGDVIRPKAEHQELPSDIRIGFVTGILDELGRKIILWKNGKQTYLEDYEENYYEVIW